MDTNFQKLCQSIFMTKFLVKKKPALTGWHFKILFQLILQLLQKKLQFQQLVELLQG